MKRLQTNLLNAPRKLSKAFQKYYCKEVLTSFYKSTLASALPPLFVHEVCFCVEVRTDIQRHIFAHVGSMSRLSSLTNRMDGMKHVNINSQMTKAATKR